ncbi:glutaredoxin family protein [Candidatus Microgenomates bacterium]|nr:MAG: glutaredoxin family protein [Candidatus Microgenomates bacterium]
MKTIIYSTTTCPYCKMLKNYLEEKGVAFEEKKVDLDDLAKEEMMKASGGFLGVPFTVVTREDGSQDTVVGFDKKRINDIYKL